MGLLFYSFFANNFAVFVVFGFYRVTLQVLFGVVEFTLNCCHYLSLILFVFILSLFIILASLVVFVVVLFYVHCIVWQSHLKFINFRDLTRLDHFASLFIYLSLLVLFSHFCQGCLFIGIWFPRAFSEFLFSHSLSIYF